MRRTSAVAMFNGERAPDVVGSARRRRERRLRCFLRHEEFDAPVYNRIHQEQIVAGMTIQHKDENPAVQEHVIVQKFLKFLLRSAYKNKLLTFPVW